jgi:iron complex outermembrane receptor protein
MPMTQMTAPASLCGGALRSRLVLAGVSAIALASAWWAPAQAAEASSAEAAAAPMIEEVVVTAGKREEKLQDVPSAISAMSASQLKANRVVDVYALVTSTPSFNITQDSAVSQQLNIRGVVSVKLNDASAEPSVGLFVDEVYTPRMGSAFTDFYDLERVEIIRGPQGVLLGKNVVGGAISVITAKPSFDPSGQITASYGNYSAVMLNGYATGPLSERIAGRVAFQVRRHDGYNENILLHRELDDLSSYQARGELLYRSEDERLRALLTLDYGHDSSNGTIRSAADDPAIAGIGTLGAYRAAHGITPRQDFSPEREYVKRRSFGATLRADWEIFEHATLTSISSYRDSRAAWGYNQIGSGSPPAIVDTFVYQVESPRSYTQELRLASTDAAAPLDWLIGAYYENDHVTRPNDHVASTFTTTTVFSGHYRYDASADTETTGVFGQAGLKLGGGFKITAGARFTHDDKTGRKIASCLADGGDGACTTPFRGPAGLTWTANYGKSWDSFTPQAVLEYRPNPSVMVYARWAKGFKGGGWDYIPPTPIAAVIPFNPEHVTNYEFGLKSDLFDRRLRLNAAVFQMDYTDLQAQRTDLTCLCLITSNAGAARIKGVEIEATAALTDALTVSASISKIDPKYIDYDDKAGHIYNGKTMQRSPKLKYNFSADYAIDVREWPKALVAHVNYTHQSKLYWAPDNISFEPGYGTLDASLRLQPPEQHWAVTVWGKNLSDKLYSVGGLPFLGDLVNVWGPPRTYGVDLTYSF